MRLTLPSPSRKRSFSAERQALSAHRAPAGPPIQSRRDRGQMLWGRRWIGSTIVAHTNLERTMTEPSTRTRNAIALDHDRTLVVVIELSLNSWLAAAVVPGIERRPLQKLSPDPQALVQLVERWRTAATKGGKTIERVAVAYEAGAVASGWRVGCAPAVSNVTSSTPPAWRCRARAGVPRPIGSIPPC